MIYSFYIKDNEIKCSLTDEYDIEEMKNPVDLLKQIIDKKYKKIKVQGNDATLTYDFIEFKFENYRKIFKLLPNEFEIIRKDIEKQEKISNKKLKNPKDGIILVIICSAALLAILNSKTGESIDVPSAETTIDTNVNDEKFEIIEETNPTTKFTSSGPIAIVNGIPWYTSELDYYLNIECENLENSPTVEYIENNYMDIIEEASEITGMSSNLIIGIISQESNGKVDIKDGLMQIIPERHLDELRKIYDLKTGKYQKFVLTNNPSKYDSDVKVFTPEDLKTPYGNIMFGTYTFAYYYNVYSDRNLFSALNSYNKGPGRQKNEVLEKAAKDYGISVDNILGDPSFVNQLLPYDDHIGLGDGRYVENIVRYIPDASTKGIYIRYMKNGIECKDVFYIEKTLENSKKY